MTNLKENNGKIPTSSCKKNIVECPETNVTENLNLNKRNSEELLSGKDNIEDDLTKNLCKETPSKVFKKTDSKRNSENDDALRDLTNVAINIAAQLQSDSKSTENVNSTSVEHAFSEFVALSLQKMEEPERSLRRDKIFHALTAPLERLL